ncbi:hypothetical protein [Beijerinckia sp. L45]|uniref:hypothetical protein n=1 Tax=Beijerinckia sp. L45 TaxID=1641855 RepID=UPI00131B64D8|nr:hypothetical protein [Beijerinckia sp. L45]
MKVAFDTIQTNETVFRGTLDFAQLSEVLLKVLSEGVGLEGCDGLNLCFKVAGEWYAPTIEWSLTQEM